jgi:hypothetical protein
MFGGGGGGGGWGAFFLLGFFSLLGGDYRKYIYMYIYI